MGIAGCESVLQNENIVLLGYSGVFLKKYMIAVIHIEPTKKAYITKEASELTLPSLFILFVLPSRIQCCDRLTLCG